MNVTPREIAESLVAALVKSAQWRSLGDVPGHEFHGNQYTDVAGGEGAAPLKESITLYHSSGSPNLPSFDAYFGGDEFTKTFGENEFGQYRYKAVLPKGTKIIDLNKDNQTTRDFQAKIVEHEWPNDKAFADQIRKEGVTSDSYDDFYGAWTDKKNIVAALKDMPGVVAKYQDEYLIPKDILMHVEVRRLRAAAEWDEDLHSREERLLGDVEGHPFHGNQYTDVAGGGKADSAEGGEYVGPADGAPRVKAAFEKADLAAEKRKAMDSYESTYATGEVRAADRQTRIMKAVFDSKRADEDARDELFDEMSKESRLDRIPVDFSKWTGSGNQRDQIIGISRSIGRIDNSGIELPDIVVTNEGIGQSRVLFGGEAEPNGFIIRLGTSAGNDTIVHEFGHHYEFNSPRLMKAAQELQEKRLPSRVDAVSRWPNPYSGKHYPAGYTEVISTGLEQFMRNPAAFRRSDREHYTLIRDMLEGKYATR